MRVLFCLALALALVAIPVVAPGADGLAVQSGPLGATSQVGGDGPSGALALGSSAAYPGLGQLLNGAEAKALIIGAVEASLIAGLLVEDRITRNSLRLHRQTGHSSYLAEYSKHFDRRQTLIWWTIFVALYSIADAYVDAHLSGVGDVVAPRLSRIETDGAPVGSEGIALCFTIRF